MVYGNKNNIIIYNININIYNYDRISRYACAFRNISNNISICIIVHMNMMLYAIYSSIYISICCTLTLTMSLIRIESAT